MSEKLVEWTITDKVDRRVLSEEESDELRRLNRMVSDERIGDVSTMIRNDEAASPSIGDSPELPQAEIGANVINPLDASIPDIGSMDDELDELGNEDIVIVPMVVMGKRVGVRKHDVYSLLDLDTKKIQMTPAGKIQRDPSREVKLGLAMELETSIYRNKGTVDKPDWVKFFDDTKGCQKWLKKPNAGLMTDELLEAVYKVNPALDGMKKLQAALANG